MHSKKLLALACAAAAVLANSRGFAQATNAPAPTPAADQTSSAPAAKSEKEETVVLTPFTVTTDKDRGYRATNSISGTRLNTAIKDLPMPIEVITEQFLRDTASTDLRQSLRFSAGVLLQTQNDYASPAGSFSVSPGKINNPEGQTASPDQSRMKIRGFETESVLRDGFRRQSAVDSINLARIEVARGPASLLYGVGNFGGVVNYIPKAPAAQPAQNISFWYGSYNFKRGTLDLTGPVSDTVGFRFTAAVQDTGDYTDFKKENHYFFSPVITWRPFKNTEILLDVEYGKQRQKGIGWQNLRAAKSNYVNDSAGYNGSFLQIPGKDLREFRWSGPDTARNDTTSNVEFKVTQKLGENLHFLAGVNSSRFGFDQLDNLAALTTNVSGAPAWAIAPVTYQGITNTQSDVPVGPQDSTISYQWERRRQDNTHNQVRVELHYDLKLFENSSKWLRMDNSFLAGLSYTKETTDDHTRQTPGDRANYHSPADFSPFRFGRQGDGSAEYALVEWDNQKTTTSNPALYAVYQGKLLDNRLTLVAGVRRDRSWNNVWRYNPEYNFDGTPRGDTEPSTVNSTTSKDTTYQYGANLDLTPHRELSLYAMHSEGVSPNYQGKLDFTGQPLQATLARNNEFGLKFDLFHGRLSGTFGRFNILRTRAQIGSSSLVWFAPVVAGNLKFDPNKDIVYNVNDLNPYTNGWNGAVVASQPQWDAAVTAGKVYQATNSAGATNWYVNAGPGTAPGGAGASFLDAVFANVNSLKQFGWWGWLYSGADPGSLPFDNLVNNATMDDNGAQKSVATGSDKATGWDTQILLQPTDNLQIYFTWSHVDKVVVDAQEWAKYPYPQDRWAIWYAPISWSATAGRPLNQVYTDPNDTSTFQAFGTGLPLDDTPKNQGTFWINYQFPKTTALKGLSCGLGGQYESERIVYPAWGQNALDNNGNTITLRTPSRRTYSGMVKYSFKLQGHDASVQLNVDNLANDRKLYGFIYAPPRRWLLAFNYKL